MSSITASPIEIHTSPEEVPSIPPWFAEVVLLARYFSQQGYLDAISQRVRLARGRAGTFDVLDFVAVLLGYAVSGEPTLEAFFDRLAPFAHPFMALFGREQLPHRATLSRFLAAVDTPCRGALRQVSQDDLLHHGCVDEQMGGFLDRLGQHLVVLDGDRTRQAARQRALATSPDLPTTQRRMEAVCAPGYTRRKRGEVVRTGTTVLQAHTQEWLGTFSNPGNGEYALELEAACRVISAYLAARNVQPSEALIRLDGLYGTIALLARMQPFNLGFVTHGRDYQLLDHPTVQARLQQPCDLSVTHVESQVQRELFDAGFIADWLPERPEVVIQYRVIVARRTAPLDPAQITVGKLREAHVYELFLTSHSASRLPAATVLELYQHRGSFEEVLSDEDDQQNPDRWCSRTACGQEFWQILSQWVWNIRLRCGQVAQPQPLRWTRWESAALVSPSAESERATPSRTVHGAVDVLVNNAGYSQAGPLEELALIAMRRQFETNVFGPLRMSQLVLPGMRRQRWGRIINLSSVAGSVTMIGTGAYTMSKHALECFSDVLRYEVKSFGVDVISIQPGGVSTNFTKVEEELFSQGNQNSSYAKFRENVLKTLRQGASENRLILKPEQVAQVILEAASVPRPRKRYRVGLLAKMLPRVRHLLPEPVWDRLVACLYSMDAVL